MAIDVVTALGGGMLRAMDRESPGRSRVRRWHWMLAGVGLIVLGLAVVAVGWSERARLLEQMEIWRQLLVSWLQVVPVPIYFLAFAILPGLGAPLTIFYLTVGAVVGHLGLSLGLAWASIAANLVLTYAIARSFLQPLIERIVERRGFEIPQVKGADEWKLVVMLRVSPIPWVFQCYLLALSGVRFVPYLALSFCIQATIGSGMIIVGESLFTGRARYALLGIFLFFAASFGASVLRRKTENAKRHESSAA